jgi:hypothetical protein
VAVSRGPLGYWSMQSPEQVVDAILAGVARRRPTILWDRSAMALATVAGAAPWLAWRATDRSVARASGVGWMRGSVGRAGLSAPTRT